MKINTTLITLLFILFIISCGAPSFPDEVGNHPAFDKYYGGDPCSFIENEALGKAISGTITPLGKKEGADKCAFKVSKNNKVYVINISSNKNYTQNHKDWKTAQTDFITGTDLGMGVPAYIDRKDRSLVVWTGDKAQVRFKTGTASATALSLLKSISMGEQQMLEEMAKYYFRDIK